MFLGSKKPTSSVGADRERMLEQAAQERRRREQAAASRSDARRVFKFLYSATKRKATGRKLRAECSAKLADIDKVESIFKLKNIAFIPPAPTLFQILDAMVTAEAVHPCNVKVDLLLLSSCVDWVRRSLSANASLLEQGRSQIIFPAFIRLVIRLALYPAAQPPARAAAIDCLMLSCRLPAVSPGLPVPVHRVDRSSYPAGQGGPSQHAKDVQEYLHSYCRRKVEFLRNVVRPACLSARPTDSIESRMVASHFVHAGMLLCWTTPHGLSTAVDEIAAFCASVLSVPWLTTRLKDTPALQTLCHPTVLDTLVSTYIAKAPALVAASQHTSLPPADGWTRRTAVAKSTGGQSTPSGAAPAQLAAEASPASPSAGFMPSTKVATIFDSLHHSAASHAGAGSFFNSEAAKLALEQAKLRDSAQEERRQTGAWPAEAYFLGNLATMLTEPLTGPCAGTGKAYVALPAEEFDAVAAEAWLVPVLSGMGTWPAVAYMRPEDACRAVQLVTDLVGSLPTDTWSTANPVVWVDKGSLGAEVQKDTGRKHEKVPVSMPVELASQLKRLSSERLAKAAAGLLLQPKVGALKLPRLRLDPDVDPERASYDDSDAYGTDLRGLSRPVGAGGGGSNLASAATGLGSVVRAMSWAGSKLAQSLFKKKKGTDSAPVHFSTFAAKDNGPDTGTSVGVRTVISTSGGAVAHGWTGPVLSGSSFVDEHVLTFCKLYAELLTVRPGTAAGGMASPEALINRAYLLRALAFHPQLALPHTLWLFMADRLDTRQWLVEAGYKAACVPSGAWAVLTVFCACMAHAVLVVDDFELYDGLANGSISSSASASGSFGGSTSGQHSHVIITRPQLSLLPPLRELRHAVRLIRDVLSHVDGAGVDSYASPTAMGGVPVAAALAAPPSPFWGRFAGVAAGMLRLLYERHCQRPLGPPSMWQVDPSAVALTITYTPDEEAEGLADKQIAIQRMLRTIPFAVPFKERVALYDRIRESDRRAHQEGCPQVKIAVQRARVFETAFQALRDLRGPDLKRKLYVTFVNEADVAESGIDAGGLFKELWTELCGVCFHPGYGLWAQTGASSTGEGAAGGDLYPNPSSSVLTGLNDEESFYFLGKITGKALYEGITVGPRWARFWLAQVLGRSPNLHDLPSLDPELYKSLMFLRTCHAPDVPDLCLTFTIAPELGSSAGSGKGGAESEIELVPGGANIAVTAANRLQYIHLVANHRLRTTIAKQTESFTRGLYEVLPQQWLAGFSPPELQVLASGSQAGIDVEDMRANTSYTGGYGSTDRVIRDFWSVVEGMSARDRAALLRFCTSCERAPPLGFSQLTPKLTIARVPIRSDADALPTSSTCFHILKLPSYSKKEVLRDKLLLAIHSGAGFELA